MRTGLTKQEKTTDIWFDEKDPLIHIRTHNTALQKRLLAYSRRYPAICQQTDADQETGCMEFEDVYKRQIYVCALKLLCPGDDKAMSYVYVCSHRAEALHMKVNRPHPKHSYRQDG